MTKHNTKTRSRKFCSTATEPTAEQRLRPSRPNPISTDANHAKNADTVITPLQNNGRDITGTFDPADQVRKADAVIAPLQNNGRNPDGTFGPGNYFGFQPGQSGNPKGRPRNARYLRERLRANMLMPFPGDPAGRTIGEVMVDHLAASAARGDFRALVQVFDRLEGSTRQPPEPDRTHDAELWNRIAAHLLAECDDNPDAKRAILAAVDKIDFEDD